MSHAGACELPDFPPGRSRHSSVPLVPARVEGQRQLRAALTGRSQEGPTHSAAPGGRRPSWRLAAALPQGGLRLVAAAPGLPVGLMRMRRRWEPAALWRLWRRLHGDDVAATCEVGQQHCRLLPGLVHWGNWVTSFGPKQHRSGHKVPGTRFEGPGRVLPVAGAVHQSAHQTRSTPAAGVRQWWRAAAAPMRRGSGVASFALNCGGHEEG